MLVRNVDGSSSIVCDDIEVAKEDVAVRAEVLAFAVHTFEQQRKDWLKIRQDAKEHSDLVYRAKCREMVLDRPPPSFDECLDLSRRIRFKREVDHPDTLRARI